MNVYREIFADFKQGELAQFYRLMYPELMVYANRLLGADFAFLAEDCVQNAVYKCYLRSNEMESVMQWKNYMYVCVHNEVVTVLRKGKAKDRYVKDLNEGSEDMLRGIIEQETLTLLYDAIEHLPEIYREVFHQSFVEGMKNTEAAQALGIAEVSYKKRKARMVELLRQELKDESYNQVLLLLFVLSH